MPLTDFPHLLEEKVWRSEEIYGDKDTFQDLLKDEMVRYGTEIKDILTTKGSATKCCDVYSGGGAQGFYSIARSLIMSFVLEKYGIIQVKHLCGNSAGGAQASLLGFYQAIKGWTYRKAVYRTLGNMYQMGPLKVNAWDLFVAMFKTVTWQQLTPQNPMESLAHADAGLADVTYGDLADKGYHVFTVFSELVSGNVGFSALKMSLKDGIRYTTRFYPPGVVEEGPGFTPTKNYLVDGGVSINLPTSSAVAAFNTATAPHNPDNKKLDFLTVSFLGNVNAMDYTPVTSIPGYFKRLLDYISIKATAKDIKETVLENQKYHYGDHDYVPLIPFGAFQDCSGEGVMLFDKESFRIRFKKGVIQALDTLKTIGLMEQPEADDLLQKLYDNFENSPELADMRLKNTPYKPNYV